MDQSVLPVRPPFPKSGDGASICCNEPLFICIHYITACSSTKRVPRDILYDTVVFLFLFVCLPYDEVGTDMPMKPRPSFDLKLRFLPLR